MIRKWKLMLRGPSGLTNTLLSGQNSFENPGKVSNNERWAKIEEISLFFKLAGTSAATN